MKVVVIDPGHGGWDSGAIALDGGLEKNFSLDLALAVRDSLTGFECDVIMTRTTDVALDPLGRHYADLARRAEIGNQHRADLLLSLHHDSLMSSNASGGSAYILSDKGKMWRPALGNHRAPNSHRIAKRIVGEVKPTLASLGIPWRDFGDPDGISCADFQVLRDREGPGVLLEAFFGSSPNDLKVARDPTFVPVLAAAIARGVAFGLDLPPKKYAVRIRMPGGRVLFGEIKDNRTVVEIPGIGKVPIRTVAEFLGHTVRWVGQEDGGPAVIIE